MPDFESHGGRLESFYDGHIPETFRFQPFEHINDKDGIDDIGLEKNSDKLPNIVRYDHSNLPVPASLPATPSLQLLSSSLPSSILSEADSSSDDVSNDSTVHVYDNVLNPQHTRMLYEVTNSLPNTEPKKTNSNDSSHGRTQLEGESPWGTYVTIEEALAWIHFNEFYSSSFDKVAFSKSGNDDESDNDDYSNYLLQWRHTATQFQRWRLKNMKKINSRDEYGNLSYCGKDHSEEESSSSNDASIDASNLDMDKIRHILAIEAVSKFFLESIPSTPGTTAMISSSSQGSSSSSKTLYNQSQILNQSHGVAVWALSSIPGQSVSYHIDYAELLRYEYNVTVPPLWAGTIHCSALSNTEGFHGHNCIKKYGNFNDSDEMQQKHQQIQDMSSSHHNHPSMNSELGHMKGGEFCVNLRGLNHYAEHGYKGIISGDTMGGWRTPDIMSDQDCDRSKSSRCIGGVHVNDSDKWVTVPYAFNRGIVHRGDLPHLSAPIEHIRCPNMNSETLPSTNSDPLTRVILGFNVFGHDVGATVAKAPEHSRQFRKKVRLYRAAMSACDRDVTKDDERNEEQIKTSTESTDKNTPNLSRGNAGGNASKNGGVDLSRIRQNKALTKLLVLAKREKVKEELRKNQEQLSLNIWQRMLMNYSQFNQPESSDEMIAPCGPLIRVSDIIEEFGSTDINEEGVGKWPQPTDVHVHIHHLLSSDRRKETVTNQPLENIDGKENKLVTTPQEDLPTSNGCLYQDVNAVAGIPGAWYELIVEEDTDFNSSMNIPGQNIRGLIHPSTRLGIRRCKSLQNFFNKLY